MFDRISFLIGEALEAMRRNTTMSFAAIITAAVALFLVGGLGYVYYRVLLYADTLTGKFEMRVVLKDGTTSEQIHQTALEIRSLRGVKYVTWIPRDKAWSRDAALHPELTEGVDNPYPDCLKVELSNLHYGDTIAAQIHAMPQVIAGDDGVQYLKDEQRFVDSLLRTLRWVGGVAGGLLFIAAGLLIYNAIRLTVLARRIEIRVMQLVGTSYLALRIPFMIEGLLHGMLGGLVASGLLVLANNALRQFLISMSPMLKLPTLPVASLTYAVCATGAIYGLICSLFAIRAPLRMR